MGSRPHRNEEPGKQLLPQLCHASALHHPRLPDQVSASQTVCVTVCSNHFKCIYIALYYYVAL